MAGWKAASMVDPMVDLKAATTAHKSVANLVALTVGMTVASLV